jgi:hypothetical protein
VIAGITESKTALGHDVAKKALQVLNKYYPHFIWYTRADGGVLCIKNNALGNACMIRHLRNLDYDDNHFTKDIIRSAGEFLERGYLKRGKWEGDYAKKLDGGDAFRWKSSHHMAYGL